MWNHCLSLDGFSYLICLCQSGFFAFLVIAKSNGFSRQLSSNCCSLLQAGACCRCFPSLTGTVYHGLLSLCPCITSLEFLSCSPCAVPPFELRSGGAVVPTIASVMSWFSNPKFRRIFLETFYGDFWPFLLVFSTKVGNSRAKAEISLEE